MEKSISQTPAPKKDRIYGSKVNAKGSASSEKSASEIKLSPKIIAALTTKLKEFRESHSNKNITLNDLKAVYRRGLGAYSTSHRPNIPRNAWAMARVNKFLLKAGGTKVKAAYVQDDDLMKYDNGGKLGSGVSEDVENYKGMFNPKETGISGLDDLLEDDGYNYFYKGISGEVVMMSPDAYLKKVRDDISRSNTDLNILDEKKENIIKGIEIGNKIDMPYLSLKENGQAYRQEGRNRATVAKERSEKLIPVFIEKKISFNDKTKKGQEYINLAIKDGATTKQEVLFKLKEQGLHRDGVRFIDENFDTKEIEQSIRIQAKYKKGGKVFNDKGLLSRYKKGESIGFTAIAHLKSKGLIKREDGTKRVSYEKGGEAGQNIKCRNCGWQWNTKDSEEYDKYVCHKCGFDNRMYYDKDPIGKYHLGGDMSLHLAPNGKPSNLTHEQWHLVRTKEFKAWFGDWQKLAEIKITDSGVDDSTLELIGRDVSKVLDDNGEPLVVYHTTSAEFNIFSKKKSKEGFFFSPQKSRLSVYNKSNIKAYFLNLRNPSHEIFKSDLKYLIPKGYDGIMDYGHAKRLGNENLYEIIAFEPNQIKLADSTNTTFDGSNPDIRYKTGGEVDERKETYDKWKSLVNMSYGEIKKFYDSKEGKDAGLSTSEAKEQGISSGRESARMLMKMKLTSKDNWTPTMWKWANKQISFISRMRGMKGELYDDNGNKTRKHTSLLIWGHNLKKDSSMNYKNGGVLIPQQGTLYTKDKKSKLEYYKKGNDYAFKVYDVENNPVQNYTRNQYKNSGKDEVLMTYNQFINYLYSELYIDDTVQRMDKYEISDYWDAEQFGGGGEVKTKKIITDKIGWTDEIADWFIEQDPKLAIWLADGYMKYNLRQNRLADVSSKEFFDLYGIEISEDPTQEEWLRLPLNFKKKIVLDSFIDLNDFLANGSFVFVSLRYQVIQILDWLKHPITPKQDLKNLSIEDAMYKARQWQDELKVIGGDIDFVEPKENEIFITYPKDKDGAEFYWVKIPSNFCSLESSRMGHCGRTGSGNTLISLRSIRLYGKGHTINDSHVTIAYNENQGIFYQTKGKKNQKPAHKYYPYIFDLIKTLATTDRYNNDYIKELEEQRDILKQKNNDLYKQLASYGYSSTLSSSEFNDYKNGKPKFSQEYQDLDREKYRLEEKLNEVKNNRDFDAINDRIDEIENEKINISRTIIDLFNDKAIVSNTINDIASKLSNMESFSKYAFSGFGAEYESNEDYGFDDMSKEQIQQLYEVNPKMFEDFGGQITLYQNGIIEEEPNTTFTLTKKARDVEDLLNGADNYRKGLILIILRGDTDSLYDYKSYSQDYIMRNFFSDINKENIDAIEERIAEITNISFEEVKENGAEYYLSGDYQDDIDEEYDFDIIFNTISRAIAEATASEYYDYLYKELKNSLEELGDVKKLDDEGVEIEIDLSKLLSSSQISRHYKEVGGNLQEIFFEAYSKEDIDLPKFNIDDRYSPYADSKALNEYLSDTEYYKHGGIVEYVLWGTKIGEPNGYESVMYVSDKQIVINQKLTDMAKSKGYDRLRVFSNNMNEKPNFIKAIKKEHGGEIINKNVTVMEKNKFDSLPSIDSVNIGDGLILYEEVFTGDLEKPRHIGRRYIVCKAIDIDNRTNFLNLKVLNSIGANQITIGSKISRPISVVFARGKKFLINGKEMNSFKNGGELNPDNKVVKQFFAHDSGNAGGVLVGKRHSEGGIKAINKSTGQPLEMEGGEVVLTRGAVSNPKKYLFEGKEMTTREISSKLNVDGGGVSFAEGGGLSEKTDCGC